MIDWMFSQIAYPYGRKIVKPLTDAYSTSSALRQMSVYHCAKSTSMSVICCTFFSFAITNNILSEIVAI